jgi:hypothetical protein
MLVILTEDEMLFKRLQLVGFNRHRMETVKRDTNIERFKAHYGSIPFVYAQILEDLQRTDIPEARIRLRRSKVLVVKLAELFSHVVDGFW